jgi:hypothetical protein
MNDAQARGVLSGFDYGIGTLMLILCLDAKTIGAEEYRRNSQNALAHRH